MKKVIIALGMVTLGRESFAKCLPQKEKSEKVHSRIYRCIHGRPDENLVKVIDLMGGIEKVVGEDDIVIIKPNVQWWNQWAPNISAVDTFVHMIMGRSGGFSGEVVIAENCHRGRRAWESAGWANKFERNSGLSGILNFNDLSKALKQKNGDIFTVCH